MMAQLNTPLAYALAGALLFTIGVAGLILCPHLLRKILAFNVMGSGAFMALVGLSQRAHGPHAMPDPVPQAMVLTGIVVAVAATALALALARHLLRLTGSMQLAEEKDPHA